MSVDEIQRLSASPMVAAPPRFMTRLEAWTVAMIALTMLLFWHAEWTRMLGGAQVGDDLVMFAPIVLLLVLVLGDLRRTAVLVAGALLLLAGLFALDAGVASLTGQHDGGPGAIAIILQLPIFVACWKHAQNATWTLPSGVLRARMLLALAAGATTWLLLRWTLTPAA